MKLTTKQNFLYNAWWQKNNCLQQPAKHTKSPTFMLRYTEKITIKVSKTQKQTLDKLKLRNVKVSQFIRDAIKEKINREAEELKPKPKKIKCPF